jgi:hypothetical protein
MSDMALLKAVPYVTLSLIVHTANGEILNKNAIFWDCEDLLFGS